MRPPSSWYIVVDDLAQICAWSIRTTLLILLYIATLIVSRLLHVLNTKCIYPFQKLCERRCDSALIEPMHRNTQHYWLNSRRPRQNWRYFADDVFKRHFLNENVWILIKISLKFVPKGPINNSPALVQIMAWCPTGDKPFSEPVLVSFGDAYMRLSASMS